MQPQVRQQIGALVMLLGGLGMLGGGVFEIVVLGEGAPAIAKITECREVATRYHTVACTGIWTTGRLVGGRGHVVTGTVDGATEADVGQSLSVRLAGGRAYVPTIRIPLILLSFGVAFLGYAIHLLRQSKRP